MLNKGKLKKMTKSLPVKGNPVKGNKVSEKKPAKVVKPMKKMKVMPKKG